MGALLGGARARELLPLALLAAAMSSALAFGNGSRGIFHRAGPHHAWVSSQHLAIAANLSPEHNFLMHMGRELGEDGVAEYEPYNRFPIGGYALIKLAILPFGDNLSAQIYAARTLMLGFFIATAALAYLAVYRLVGSRWAALAATLLAFSSGYFLYYNDMISNEVGIDLFGVMLTFHGMVVFAREGRFRQLLVKACLAVCLGWHVYALLLPFIAIGVAGELVGALRGASALPLRTRARGALGALVRSRHIALGAAALGVGLAMLALNFGSEYLALGGETALAELPSVEAALARTGISHSDEELADYLNWGHFLGNQFARIGVALVPSALGLDSELLFGARGAPGHYLLFGLAGAAACAVGLFFARDRALWGTLAVAGFCWALPMRRTTAVHNYEAVYYVGIPLFLFALLMVWIGNRHGARVVRDLSVAAMAVFVASAFQMSQWGGKVGAPSENESHAARVRDFEAIRAVTDGGTVFIAQGHPKVWTDRLALQFYMHGNVFVWEYNWGKADFIVSGVRRDTDGPLTPDNQAAFLYDNRGGGLWAGKTDWLVENGEPIYRGEYNVYGDGRRVFYIGAPGTFQTATLSEGFPAVGDRIEATLNIGRRIEDWRWERGDDAGGWRGVSRQGVSRGNRFYIPGAGDAGYRMRARVNYIDDGGVQGEAVAAPTEPVSEFRAATAADGGGGRAAALPRFFLHVLPVDEDDLPDAAKASGAGFENLDFGIERRLFDPGRDMRQTAMAELPPYPIAAIKTGQYTREGKIWEARARFEGGEWIAEPAQSGGGE